MNKEEMINALNSLAARIKAGQLDIDDVALRNAEIEKVDARIENYKRELKEIEEIEKSGYTKGSEHDLAVEKMKEIQNRITNVNERIYANHQVQEKLREHITANNKIIAKNNRDNRRFGDGELSESDEKLYNERIQTNRELSRDNALKNNALGAQAENDRLYHEELDKYQTELTAISNNLNSGLNTVNEKLKQDTENRKRYLEDLLRTDEEIKTAYSRNFGNEIQGLVKRLENNEISIPKVGDELNEIIEAIPTRFFVDDEELAKAEHEENLRKQREHEYNISELNYKLQNKEKFFDSSALFKEDIELKRIEMENKFIKNSLPLREKDLRINEINDSILEDYETIKEIETKFAAELQDPVKSKRYKKMIDMYKNEIQVYENDIERIKDEDYQKIDKEREDAFNALNAYREMLGLELLDKNINLLNEEDYNKFKTSVDNYNNIDDEELVDFNRRIANVILNEQEIEEAEKELKLHEDALNSLREHDTLSTKSALALAAEAVQIANQEKETERINLENHRFVMNDVPNNNLNEQLQKYGVKVDLDNKLDEPEVHASLEQENEKDETFATSTMEEQPETPVVEEEVSEPVIEEGKLKAKFKKASDKLRQKAKEIKNNGKLGKWSKRLTALALAAAVTLGVGKLLNKQQMDEIQKPDVIEEIDNGEKTIDDILNENIDDKTNKEENIEDKTEVNNEENKENQTEVNENNEEINNENSENKEIKVDKPVNDSNLNTTNNMNNTFDNGNSQYPSTNDHDNSDEISVPDNNNQNNDVTEEPVVEDAVIEDNNDKKDDEITIEDAVIEDENNEKEDVYDNEDAVIEDNENNDNEITIEDAVVEDNNNNENEEVFDNSDNIEEDNKDEVIIEDSNDDVTVEDSVTNEDDAINGDNIDETEHEEVFDNSGDVETPSVEEENNNNDIVIEDAPVEDNNSNENNYDNSENIETPSVEEENNNNNDIVIEDAPVEDNNYNENNYDNSESIETPSVEENNNNITIEDVQEETQTEQQDTIDVENTSYNTQEPIAENSSYVTSKKLSIDELQQLRTEFANMQLEQTTEEQSMTR
ncbi:MAG: hypothetical protein PUA68_02015 [Bacilli bacterium]|nr:hypothetical protein [Bacilli bacterium]